MNPVKCIIGVLLFCLCPIVGNAAEQDDYVASMFDEVINAEAKQSPPKTEVLLTGTSDRRLDDIERRLDQLERTSIDASEAEAIAEKVVQRYIKQLRVAISQPGGGQRTQTVQFRSPTDIQGFDLAPGEQLVAYSDVLTGKTVVVGQPTSTVQSTAYAQPVPTWSTSEVVIQSQPAPVNSYRRVAVRPVVQTYAAPRATTSYRRGVFGRQVMRTTASPTCRMVNGVQVCN